MTEAIAEDSQLCTGYTISTVSGLCLDYADPKLDQICLEDIANGLASNSRFSGQLTEPYSVAEHSVAVAAKLQILYHDPTLSLQGLLHDASEGYTQDLSRPLKNLCPDFRRVEGRLQKVIYEKFGLSTITDPRVKEVDNRMLLTERDYFQPGHSGWKKHTGVLPYSTFSHPVVPPRWKSRFEWNKDRFLHWYAHLSYKRTYGC